MTPAPEALAARGPDDVAAISVAGQQHGTVCLDEYVADGAARQAADVLRGGFPRRQRTGTQYVTPEPMPGILSRYRGVAATQGAGKWR